MRLDEVTPLITAVATPRLTTTLNAWRVGQVLDAVVTRISNVGSATLNVNNISLDIHSELPLTVGTQLRLEVAQSGAQITLRVLTPPLPKDVVADALRVLAPRQSALAPFLTELAKLTLPTTVAAPSPRLTSATAAYVPTVGGAVAQLPSVTAGPASTPAVAALLPLPPTPTTLNVPIVPNTPTAASANDQAPAPLPVPALPASLANALATAPPALRELAKNVINRIGTPTQTTTPDALKQAIKNAGPFFEHQLATAATPGEIDRVFDQDLKAGLLKLVSLIKTFLPQLTPPNDTPAVPPPQTAASAARAPATPHAAPLAALLLDNTAPLATLAKEADAALARITTQQLLSLPDRGADAPQWIFDLPLRSGERVDVFHLHVFREQHSRDAKQPPAWCVRLSFDLVTLGKVNALVTLFAGSISVAMWAQQNTTALLFEQHLATLRNELQTAGVAVGNLRCECGDAPFSADASLKKKRSGLIDERA